MTINSLLPGMGDLFLACRLALVFLLSVGCGALFGARRVEVAMFVGWGVASTMLVAVGTLTGLSLQWPVCLLAVMGLWGLLRRWTPVLQTDRLAWMTGLVGLPFILLPLNMTDIGWDDLSFWGPNLLHLCRTNHFPNLAVPNTGSLEPGYPYGLAFIGYMVRQLGGAAEGAEAYRLLRVGILWNVLCLLAAAACLARHMLVILQKRRIGSGILQCWGVVCCAVLFCTLLCPTFVAKITYTNMGDSATGVGLALLVGQLLDFAGLPANAVARVRWRMLVQTLLMACAVVAIRQANIALLGLFAVGVGLAALLPPTGLGWKRALPFILALTVAPGVVWFGWERYVAHAIPGGTHHVLPMAQWHWNVLGETLAAAGHILKVKSGYTLMLALLVGAGAVALVRGRGRMGQPLCAALVVVSVLSVGNIVFLLLCYLATSFDILEARQAITFWRFIGQTGLAEVLVLVLVLVSVLPAGWRVRSGSAKILCLLGVVLIWATPTSIFRVRDDLASPVPVLEHMGADMEQGVPPGAPLVLVDVSGNGFSAVVEKFVVQVIMHDHRSLRLVDDPAGITADRIAASVGELPAPGYYWLAQGAADMPPFLGYRVRAGCSALFRVAPDHAVERVRSWALGAHRWQTMHYESTPIPGETCQ